METNYHSLTPGKANLILLGIFLVGGLFALSGPVAGGFVTQSLFAGTVFVLMSAGEWPARKIFRLGWPGIMPLALAALAGPVVTILSGALSILLHLSLTEKVGPLPVITGLEESGLGLIILAVLAAPIVEEFFFRGYLQRAYEHAWPKGGWIFAGILFGVIHAGAGMVRILTAPIIGLFYAWLFWRTKSLWPGVVAHLTGNAIAFFLVNPFYNLLVSDAAPPWLWAVMAASAIIGFFLLLGIHTLTPWHAAEEKDLEVPSLGRGADHPASRLVVAGIIVLMLLGQVSLELSVRREGIQAHGQLSYTQHYILEPIVLAEFESTRTGELVLSYMINSDGVELVLVDPRGMFVPVVNSHFGERHINISTPGIWQITLQGSGNVRLSGNFVYRERR